MSSTYVIGVDFGSDSCRCVIADTTTGEELASAVAAFPRWAAGLYCDPMRRIFRQHPQDHLDALTQAVRAAVSQVTPAVRAGVRGLSIATTGSTSAPVDETGCPLALRPAFADNPNAMFLMWKDHSATLEAEQITAAAKTWGGVDYTAHIGGVYSAEWYWANLLWVFRHDAQVRAATASWVEHCDWLPAELTGTTAPRLMRRSRCAAGHKAMWNEGHGGLPSQAFLSHIDPLLDGIRARLYEDTWTAETPIGTLTPAWAGRLGLPDEVVVGVGAFDAHMGAVGAGIRAHTLVKIMGTSTCDIVLAPTDELGDRVVEGICGQVDGSVMAGAIGLEAGQSAVGDGFAWFARVLEWPLPEGPNRDALRTELLPMLERAAALEPPGAHGVAALDWLNGRRTPYADQTLHGALFGLSLGSSAPQLYRALVEATAFGAKAIVDRFTEAGVRIDEVLAIGGVARKSALLMQIQANVFDQRIRVAKSEQAVALGAAMCAAVACGLHADIPAAQQAMACGFDLVYEPQAREAAQYRSLFRRYQEMGALVQGMKQEVMAHDAA
ncbi:ribulokinase [Variovorax sp. PAMC26660]|nr:ribulokinase [Variovorax sp. PAMC26660]